MSNDVEKFDGQKARVQKPKLTAGQWFKTKMVPFIGKLGNQRHLAAIKDSFGTMIPLIIAGSIGVLINAIIFGGAGSGEVSLLGLICKASTGKDWTSVHNLITGTAEGADSVWNKISQICGLGFGHMNTATIGMISIYFSFLFGYYIAQAKNFQQPVMAGLVSLAAFILAVLGDLPQFSGAPGLITAIIFGILATELFIYLAGVNALKVKMPDSVPPAVGRSFAVFLPVVLTLMTVGVINIIFLAPAIATHDLFVTGAKNGILNSNLWFATHTAKDGWNAAAGLGLSSDDAQKLLSSLKDAGINTDDLQNAIKNLNDFGTNLSHFALDNKGNVVVNKTDIAEYNKDLEALYKALIDIQKSDAYNDSIQNQLVNLLFSGAGNKDIVGILPDYFTNLDLVFKNVDGKVSAFSVSSSWTIMSLDWTHFGSGAAIFQFVTSWFLGFATSKGAIGLALAFVLFVGILWFFGLHGTNILSGIFDPIWLMILAVNLDLVTQLGYEAAAATHSMGVFAKSFFDSYVWIGAAGATLPLLIMTLSLSKRRELKEIAKYATPAGVFQINEPVIFGYPLVFNGIYAIPFIFAPFANTIIAWLFSPDVMGVVNYPYIQAPWTAPWFLGAVLSTLDAKALIPAFICFGVDIAMYLPFVLIDNSLYWKKLKKQDPEKYEIEVKYYTDPAFKWSEDTNSKFNNLIMKADMVELGGQENSNFWAKRISNPEKLKLRQDKTLEKANNRANAIREKAETIKTNREAKGNANAGRWAAIYQSRLNKISAREAKKEARIAAKQ